MKKNILMVLVVLVLVGSLGCADGSNTKVREKADNLNPNFPYSIRENMSVVLKKEYVEERLGKADITRKLEKKTYEIRNKDDGSLIVVTYDNESGRLLDVWRLKELYERQDFEVIINGESTSKDVVLVDPYTIVFEKSGKEGISEHRLINDEVAIIRYKQENGSWRVYDISFEKDPLGFSTLISTDDNIFDNK